MRDFDFSGGQNQRWKVVYVDGSVVEEDPKCTVKEDAAVRELKKEVSKYEQLFKNAKNVCEIFP